MKAFKSYLEVLMNAGYYSGRSGRREFWMFALFNTIVIGALAGLARLLGQSRAAEPIDPRVVVRSTFSMFDLVIAIIVLYVLVVLIPGLAVAVRRLHDTGRSGLYLLLWNVPFGLIALLIFFAQEGDFGNNQYGPNPSSSRSLPCQELLGAPEA